MKWTQEQINKLQKLYPITESWEFLCKQFPFSTKRGIQGKAASLGLRKVRIINHGGVCNHQLFNQWNEISAYLLGYMEADCSFDFKGRHSTITFATSEKDLTFLIDLHSLTKSSNRISKKTHWLQGPVHNTKHYTFSFVVSSQQWKKQIQNLIRQKRVPKEIPKNLIHHYIRGYFDGDGSIYFNKQTKNYKSSFVFSSKQLANSFKTIINDNNILTSNVHKKINAQCWYFQLGYHQTKKIGEFMYQDSNLYLNRKYQRFQSQKQLYDS